MSRRRWIGARFLPGSPIGACEHDSPPRRPRIRSRPAGATMTKLVTGAAGFIGFHVARQLLERGDRVIGVDSVNDYYSVALKEARLAQLRQHKGFTFYKANIAHQAELAEIGARHPEIGGGVPLPGPGRRRHLPPDPPPPIQAYRLGPTLP